jgi:SAM-dependent methyltransferase
VALNLAAFGIGAAGVDLSPNAVRMAQEAFRQRGLRGEFVLGDVRDIPFPDESFDFVYAGGVIELFRESNRAVAEMTRVLRPGGRLLLTVPAFTLSYPYLFLRGNVPAVALMENAASFLHFRVLRGKLATFGYERSFRRGAVRQLLLAAGLVDVEVGRFDTYLPLLQLPQRAREPARRLARTKLFAPMYYATGLQRRPPDSQR